MKPVFEAIRVPLPWMVKLEKRQGEVERMTTREKTTGYRKKKRNEYTTETSFTAAFLPHHHDYILKKTIPLTNLKMQDVQKKRVPFTNLA